MQPRKTSRAANLTVTRILEDTAPERPILDEPQPTEIAQRAPGDFYRDRAGSPYITDPDGQAVKTGRRQGEIKRIRYGRPSALGKQIENSYALQRWNERKIVEGVAYGSPTLNERVAALQHADPSTPEWGDIADAVIVEAKRLADAGIAAERGTHIHELSETVDLGGDPIAQLEAGTLLGLTHNQQHAMLEAWNATLARYQIEILAVELRVVNDRWKQAGTIDRVARNGLPIPLQDGTTIPAGTVFVLDLKTGKMRTQASGRVLWWHSYAIQVVAYNDSTPYNPDTEQRQPWPRGQKPNRKIALIAHLPVEAAQAGVAVCRLVAVDLEAARVATTKLVMGARQWQASDPFTHTTDRPTYQPVSPEPEPVELTEDELGAYADLEDDALNLILDTFPDTTTATRHSVNHQWGHPAARWGDGPHDAVETAPLDSYPPDPINLGEGAPIDDHTYQQVRDIISRLPDNARTYLNGLAARANTAGASFSLTPGPGRTTRRLHIYQALLTLAGAYPDLDDTHIEAALRNLAPTLPADINIAAYLGALTIPLAEQLDAIVNEIVEHGAWIAFNEQGGPYWIW